MADQHMQNLEHRWQSLFFILLAGSFLFLLPFSRSAEIPMLLLALAAPYCWWQQRHNAELKPALRCASLVFAAFAIPMLISSPDSYAPQKSWVQSLSSLRFYFAAITLIVIFNPIDRLRTLQSFLGGIILLWAVDAVIQFVLGYNLLGYIASNERLGGVFGDDIWFFGPTLAMLSPLAFEWLWQQPKRWLRILGFMIIPTAILLSGMRAGWLLLPVLAAIYSFRLIQQHGRAGWRVVIIAALISAIGAAVIIQQSPLVQQRITQSLQLDTSSENRLQDALSERWLIWKSSLQMVQTHPINGVGVRAFPSAYPHFTRVDDPQLIKHGGDRGARHAHHVWLEALTDCGLIGLLGLLLCCYFLWQAYRRAHPQQRLMSRTYLFCLALILFPLNTHFSLYGTFLSSLLWWLIGLSIAALFCQHDQH